DALGTRGGKRPKDAASEEAKAGKVGRGVPRRATMVLGDAAGPVSQLTPEHRYRPGTSHGVSLRPSRTRVKRSLGRGRELSYVSTRSGNGRSMANALPCPLRVIIALVAI